MPNWCYGYVEVKGKSKDIENFCKLFLFDDDKPKKKYFARSFIDSNWKDFKKETLGSKEVGFGVSFAWSGGCCLIDGYPLEKENKDCVTLNWACKKYNVEVDIQTEEGGMGFEEHIYYTKKNNGVVYDSWDMDNVTCGKCGEKELVSSQDKYDLDNKECCNCGEIGNFGQDDELQKIIKEKLNQMENKNEQNMENKK